MTTAVLPRSRFSVGAALCLVSATGFGLAAIFARESASPVSTLLTARFALAAMVFWALVAWRRPALPSRRALLTCVGLGAIGYAAQAGFYFSALNQINASLVALLLYAYPALVTGIAVALRRESLDRRRTAALACSVSGLVLLLGGGVGPGALSGVLLALGAAVTYAVYLTVADGLPDDLDLYLVSAVVCSGATVSLAVAGLTTGSLHAPARPSGWLWIAMLALFSTVIGIIFMFAGIRAVGAPVASILSCAEPAVTVASTALVYGERLTAGQILGGTAVLATVLVLSGQGRDRPSRAQRR